MACCLTAQSLYVHQCSQILSDVLCHSQTQCGLVASLIWSLLVQVIACCLTIQSHYLNRLNMDFEDLWHLYESSIMRNTRFINHCLKTTFRSPRGQWTRQHRHIIDWWIVSVPHMWQLFVVQSDICPIDSLAHTMAIISHSHYWPCEHQTRLRGSFSALMANDAEQGFPVPHHWSSVRILWIWKSLHNVTGKICVIISVLPGLAKMKRTTLAVLTHWPLGDFNEFLDK